LEAVSLTHLAISAKLSMQGGKVGMIALAEVRDALQALSSTNVGLVAMFCLDAGLAIMKGASLTTILAGFLGAQPARL
jgi:hypothetical protein